mmetsp:Transcript_34690/g.74986  ORF Transcript_34690/g.74986 Transcript_34690/m.74986 type:complete len:87 (-) Transcript_34690:24-284(-)
MFKNNSAPKYLTISVGRCCETKQTNNQCETNIVSVVDNKQPGEGYTTNKVKMVIADELCRRCSKVRQIFYMKMPAGMYISECRFNT